MAIGIIFTPVILYLSDLVRRKQVLIPGLLVLCGLSLLLLIAGALYQEIGIMTVFPLPVWTLRSVGRSPSEASSETSRTPRWAPLRPLRANRGAPLGADVTPLN